MQPNNFHHGTAPFFSQNLSNESSVVSFPQQNPLLGNNSSPNNNNNSTYPSSFNNFHSGSNNNCYTPSTSITQFSSPSDKTFNVSTHQQQYYNPEYSFNNTNNNNANFTLPSRPTTSTINHHQQQFNTNSAQQQLDDQDSFFRRHSSNTVNTNFQNEKISQNNTALPFYQQHNYTPTPPAIQSSLPSLNNLLQTNVNGNNLIEEDIDELPPTIDMSRIRSNSSHVNNNQQQQNVSNRSGMNNEGIMNQSNLSNYSKSKSLSVPTPPSCLSNPMMKNSYHLSPSYASNNNQMIMNMQYDIKKTPSPSNSINSQTLVDSNQLPSIHSLTNDMMDTTSNSGSSYVHRRGHSDPTNLSKTVPYNIAHRGNLHLSHQQISPSSPSTQMSCNTPNLMSITTPVSTPSSYVSTARSVVSPNTPSNISNMGLGNDRTSSPFSNNPPTIQITSQKSKSKSNSVKSPGYDQLWFNTKYRFMGRNKYTEFKTVQGEAPSPSDSKITKSSKMKKNLNVNSPIQ